MARWFDDCSNRLAWHTVYGLKRPVRFKSIVEFTEGIGMKNSKGFSLLELLIVVAIILIIATIAIPSLLRSRQAANESAAVANLRTINTAEVTYLSSSAGKFGLLP